MDKNQYFLKSKDNALKKLNKAINENKLDKKIKYIINLINSNNNYFTSSSCSGRIVIIEIPEIGDKKQAKFLGKWHREIHFDEVINSVNTSKSGMIWLLAQSPILHVKTKSISSADKLIKIAISSGFKNSGIKSITGNIVVEICSTERLDTPIGKNGILFSSENHLKFLVDISNYILKKSRRKLNLLKKNLKNKILIVF